MLLEKFIHNCLLMPVARDTATVAIIQRTAQQFLSESGICKLVFSRHFDSQLQNTSLGYDDSRFSVSVLFFDSIKPHSFFSAVQFTVG
jgi:hypothetical protein